MQAFCGEAVERGSCEIGKKASASRSWTPATLVATLDVQTGPTQKSEKKIVDRGYDQKPFPVAAPASQRERVCSLHVRVGRGSLNTRA